MGINRAKARCQSESLKNAVRNGTPWADWEIDMLQALRDKGMPLRRIAYMLNRSFWSVHSKVYKSDKAA